MEFRTRKAHRWVVREKDLLKYWAVMITCVSVYLASGTISTLEHSEPGEHLIWKVWDSGSSIGDNAVVLPTSLPVASINQSRSHLLFPKSIKGESSGNVASSSSTSVRIRTGDGPRSRSTNASFLLQKARVLRRGAEINPSAMPVTNDTLLINTDGLESKTLSLENNTLDSTAGLEGLDTTTEFSNQTNKLCDPGDGSLSVGGSSLLYVRFQVNSGSYFTVCRQLWWHYVNMAGKNKIQPNNQLHTISRRCQIQRRPRHLRPFSTRTIFRNCIRLLTVDVVVQRDWAVTFNEYPPSFSLFLFHKNQIQKKN